MAYYSIVSHSSINRERLDPEYYEKSFLENDQILKLLKTRSITADAEIYDGIAFPSKYFGGSGEMAVAKITDVVQNTEVKDWTRISKDVCSKYHSVLLEDGDILFCATHHNPWDLGKVRQEYYSDKHMTINQRVFLFRSKLSLAHNNYLFAYLQTNVARKQIQRWGRGNNQLNLNNYELSKIQIPILEDDGIKQISNTINEFHEKKQLSQSLYNQAHHLLESELGLGGLSSNNPMGYSAQFSDTLVNDRVDADYFQPQFRKIKESVREHHGGYERLIDSVIPLSPNYDPSSQPFKQFRYIELADINAGLGMVGEVASYKGVELPSRARRIVKSGDVIASAVVGSLDKSALIEEQHTGFLASTGFFHLRPLTVTPQYLLMLLRSRCVTMQLRQEATGGILSSVPDSRLKHVIVPKIANELKVKISEMVINAHDKKRDAERLLDEAKAKVEHLIEKAIQP